MLRRQLSVKEVWTSPDSLPPTSLSDPALRYVFLLGSTGVSAIIKSTAAVRSLCSQAVGISPDLSLQSCLRAYKGVLALLHGLRGNPAVILIPCSLANRARTRLSTLSAPMGSTPHAPHSLYSLCHQERVSCQCSLSSRADSSLLVLVAKAGNISVHNGIHHVHDHLGAEDGDGHLQGTS